MNEGELGVAVATIFIALVLIVAAAIIYGVVQLFN